MVRRYPLGRAAAWAAALALAFLFGRMARPIHAQAPANLWREPTLIAANTGSQWAAQVAGDAAGHIYVLWPGYSAFAQPNAGEDVFYFRAWDGVGWSEAVDVLAVPQGVRMLLDRFVIDRFGRLLVLWHTGSELFLSSAMPDEAQSAAGWQTIRLRAGELVWGADVALGADGSIHVIFAGEGQDIAYLQSTDLGATWSEPAAVNLGDDPLLQGQYPTLALGSDGVLHASWTLHDGRHNWAGSHVFYSRSVDQGDSWSEPFALVERVGHGVSGVTADGQGRVWVFWDRSVGSEDGRYYAYSEDNGLTWRTPLVAYYNISGMSGLPRFIWDGSGRLRLFSSGQGPQGTEIWQSVWQGDGWGRQVPLLVQGKGTGSEVFFVALAGGDTLLAVWTDYYTDDIWLTSQRIAAQATADGWLPTPTPPPTPTALPEPTFAPTPAPRALLKSEDLLPPPSGLTTALSFPLLVVTLVVAALIGVLLLYREVRR